ncbi:MAG: RNA pseudouridine synthase [Bacteroidales bacterium]|nr:RNA pseudouridine synthase [Bacteroidales bacterium]
MTDRPGYLHPLEYAGEALPKAFTYPFRYTPHPLCRRAALVVRQHLQEMGVDEGKMYGVLVVEDKQVPGNEDGKSPSLCFLAAYSGQLNGNYDHPWFVPPVVDYLDPDSHFQREQQHVVDLNRRIETLENSEKHHQWVRRLEQLKGQRSEAVVSARRIYAEGKARRDTLRSLALHPDDADALVRESQQQKADIQRAKRLYASEIACLEDRIARHQSDINRLAEERKRLSEDLQQWLFRQFSFSNARGEQRNLLDIFGTHLTPPSGAGECCAPKLLQAAFRLGLKPLAMAEFWWGPSQPGLYRQPGAFFPACRSKCHPILSHMLQGLNVEPDPALHYDRRLLSPVRVIWEDADLAVVMKPEGWVSIPGKSDQPCLLDECYRLWPGIEGPVIVHRLDMDTSGLMVVAKNARVHRALARQFEEREVHKRYIALLEQAPMMSAGVVAVPAQGMSTTDATEVDGAVGQCFELSLPIGPDMENMPRQRVDYQRGKEAVTRFVVLGEERAPLQVSRQGGGISHVVRVAFYPLTGRTHQLRVHASAFEGLNAPILGDRLYGHVADRLYLHAEALVFVHPTTRKTMHFEEKCPF